MRYLGRRGVRALGEHDWTMPRERVAQLLARTQSLLEHPPEEVGGLVDATPNCLFVSDGARELLRCVSPGHDGSAANELGEYLAFKTNAVMWLGEAGGDHCRPPLVPPPAR